MTPRLFVCSAGLLFFATILCPLTSVAQVAPAAAAESAAPCATPKQRAEYPEGYPALFRYLTENVQYPVLAKQQRIQGRVLVKFLIDSTGVVRDARVTKGIGGGCDEEALRMVNALGRFTPARQDCKPVDSQMEMPVEFTLAAVKRK